MRIELALVFLAACGSDREVPTCQQAFSHFYGEGCVFRNLQTGDVIPRDELIAGCQQSLATQPSRCDDDLDDFLVCLSEVDMVVNDADCDCSREQEALLSCQ